MKQILLISLCIFSQLILAQSLPDNIDISTSPNGVVDMPSTVPAVFISDGFVKYTKIQCPNGEAIHIVAQSELSDAQIVRSRSILEFYLNDFEGSEYGSDKTNVINTMGSNDAVLLLMNGSDGDGPEPNVWGQPLFNDELPVEGHQWFMIDDYDEHRDAAFEEILHFMHDNGIGVDGPNAIDNPALPDYQAEIRAAQINAGLNNFAIWPIGADGTGPDPFVQEWYNELDQENSLSQEYLASVIDSYYGLWAPWTDDPNLGMWGMYIAHDRAEIETEDPMGYAVLEKYFSPYINIDMIIDPSMNEVFSMNFNSGQAYTHKSQYLQHCYLTGSNNSGLLGNDLYNRLKGNSGNNTLEGIGGNDRLDGLGGENTAIFTGDYSEYSITNNIDHAIVSDGTPDRDGVDTLWNIHSLQFSDQMIELTLNPSGVEENTTPTFSIYPNPTTNIIYTNKDGRKQIFDILGKQLITTDKKKITVAHLQSGVYFIKQGNQSLKFIKQ